MLWPTLQVVGYLDAATGGVLQACEFCEIFKNTFFTEHLQMTAPGHLQIIAKKNAYFESVLFNIRVEGFLQWLSVEIFPQNYTMFSLMTLILLNVLVYVTQI